ncbi:DUF2971 domain-containing protein [Butyrivibrio sp. DSM 10294]|uniref:DUF2971 domain-containing protein n=1 Tax=Butyrivibrio sp. DSM 10294 TaxID=2972457 RepID=UPI00234F7080|nr:DUF2971 domain-containing protein [Butyrivibrio sp. DSM 10294]MDC7293237.1 DUF2971 domain-containing protein [Butyrivibrio sp. DSM 10294]
MDISLDIFREDIRIEPEKDRIYHDLSGIDGVSPGISDDYEKSWNYTKKQDASDESLDNIFNRIKDCLSHVNKMYYRLIHKVLLLHEEDAGKEIATLEGDVDRIFDNMFILDEFLGNVQAQDKAYIMINKSLEYLSKLLANLTALKRTSVDDFILRTVNREQEFIKENIGLCGSIADISYIFSDVGDLYLFHHGDLNNAEKYYRIGVDAFEELRLDSVRDQYEDEFEENLVKPCKTVDALRRVLYNVNSTYKLEDDLAIIENNLDPDVYNIVYSFIKPYRELIKKDCCDEKLMHDAWEQATKCFWSAKSLIDALDDNKQDDDKEENDKIGGTARAFVWITYIIIDHALPFGLYLLSNMDVSKVPDEIFENAVTYYDKMPFFSNYIRALSGFVPKENGEETVEEAEKNENENNIAYLRELLLTIGRVEVIKEILRVRKLPKNLAYYTTFDTLGYILPKSADLALPENKYAGKYSVMHIGHMNDPNEGKVLKRRIYDNKKSSDSLSYPYVFLKSFTTRVDDLSMWETYGNSAEGVCVELDTDRILDSGNYKLYNICYMQKGGSDGYVFNNISGYDSAGSAEMKEYIESILNWLEEKSQPKEEHPSKSENELSKLERRYRSCFDYIIHGITYLFKDADYSHEDEKRIIYSFDGYDDKRIIHTPGTTPRLLVYSEQDAVIKRIILGPKFKKVEDNLPYLQYRCEALAKKLHLNPIEIIKSHIAYI